VNLGQLFAQHRNAFLAAGAGVVVVGATVVRRRSGSSSPAASAGYPPTYDTTQTDSAQQFDQNLQAQEDYINAQVGILSSILAGVKKPPPVKAPRPKAKKPKPKKKPVHPKPNPRRRTPANRRRPKIPKTPPIIRRP
jgi:hypothetical protein